MLLDAVLVPFVVDVADLVRGLHSGNQYLEKYLAQGCVSQEWPWRARNWSLALPFGVSRSRVAVALVVEVENDASLVGEINGRESS
jgi:hypothetical protein